MLDKDLPPHHMQMAKGAFGVLLLMVLILQPAYQRFFSMAAAYVSGTFSATFVTCPNQRMAKNITRAAVEKWLVACANIIPQVTSIYEWKGKVKEDSEVLLMIKTRSSRILALAEFVWSVEAGRVKESPSPKTPHSEGR
uniref:Protein CutA homolog n=1 Tax=Pogona vitticeps TaxID=103695 RepID=A0ABM5FCU7_9SAUR